jgi:GlcNAc-P-P-Und epimerase
MSSAPRMPQRGQTIVVTGGSGFIGTVLVRRLLAAGHKVRILDTQQSRTYPELTVLCDVRDAEATRSVCAGADVIYNLAAVHHDDVRPLVLYEEVNVQGARNVCAAAEANGIRKIVFTSSVAVYGFAPSELDESAEPNPFNEYGRTKLMAEGVFREWATRNPDCGLVIVRPSVVFGEGNRGNVYNLLHHLAGNRFVMVGSGENKKSIAYVENVAAFLEFSLGFGAGVHVFNYADKPDMDMNSLVARVRTKLGKPARVRFRLPYSVGLGIGTLFDWAAWATRSRFPISAVRVRKFCESTRFSAARARIAGFIAPVPLQDALDRTIESEFTKQTAD